MTVSRGSDPLPEPQPVDDPNPTSVNIAEYERLARERDDEAAKSEPKSEPKTTAKKANGKN